MGCNKPKSSRTVTTKTVSMRTRTLWRPSSPSYHLNFTIKITSNHRQSQTLQKQHPEPSHQRLWRPQGLLRCKSFFKLVHGETTMHRHRTIPTRKRGTM